MGKKSGQNKRPPPGGRAAAERRVADAVRREAYLAAARKEVPSPEEMEAALDRVRKAQAISFEVELAGSWRAVTLTDVIPMSNRYKPELVIIFFKPVLLVATPSMPEVAGWLAVSLCSLSTHRATLLSAGETDVASLLRRSSMGRAVSFRPTNEESGDWLRLVLAKASGMRYREHSMVDPSKIIYTRDA